MGLCDGHLLRYRRCPEVIDREALKCGEPRQVV